MEASFVRRLELALAIEPDGGMPGADDEERALASLLALLCFLAVGSTESSGIFRPMCGGLCRSSKTCRSTSGSGGLLTG
jgi:hypothetical protein